MHQRPMSPSDLTPRVPKHLTAAQRVALWLELFDASEAFALAGLRRVCKPGEDLVAAYRQWYQEQMIEHDRSMRLMAENFYRRGVRHGR
jgi:hypothetical protein